MKNQDTHSPYNWDAGVRDTLESMKNKIPSTAKFEMKEGKAEVIQIGFSAFFLNQTEAQQQQ